MQKIDLFGEDSDERFGNESYKKQDHAQRNAKERYRYRKKKRAIDAEDRESYDLPEYADDKCT